MNENSLQILVLTETWLKRNDNAIANSATPNGFLCIRADRQGKQGGGVAILYSDALTVKRVKPHFQPNTFEYLAVNITFGKNSTPLCIVGVYRPPGSSSFFAEELQQFLLHLNASEHFLICGDMNIHFDNAADTSTRQITSALNTFNCAQLVQEATHEHQHILDVVITPNSQSSSVSHLTVSELVSDHMLVSFNFLHKHKPTRPSKSITYRALKNIDHQNFKEDIRREPLTQQSGTSDILAEAYNETAKRLLDKHSPLVTRTVQIRHCTKWITKKVLLAKRRKRAAERKWRSTGLEVHRLIHRGLSNHYIGCIREAKANFVKEETNNLSSRPKELWKRLKSITQLNQKTNFPQEMFSQNGVDSLAKFFTERPLTIVASLPVSSKAILATETLSTHKLDSFHPTNIKEILFMLRTCPRKSSHVDPWPTEILLQHKFELVSFIVGLVNTSLSEGIFPTVFKHAVITPLLKGQDLDPTILSHYRPVANLPFLSKILERIVSQRLQHHLESHNRLNSNQSAYRPNCSTETAMEAIHDSIARNSDAKRISLLLLLDMSAAFDTINHSFLIQRLQQIGVCDLALKWLESYLSGRSQSVSVGRYKSGVSAVTLGVPQGSVLGPTLFNIYMTPVADLLQDKDVNAYQVYADDIQFVVSCQPEDIPATWRKIELIVNTIENWASSNSLKFNACKTNAIAFGLKSQSELLKNLPPLQLTSAAVDIQLNGKSLGVTLDSELTMEPFISSTRRASFAALSSIRQMQAYINPVTAKMLIHAFVLSRVDYCASLLVSLPTKSLDCLQSVINCAARTVRGTSRFSHISPVINELGWLRMPSRIALKVLLMTHSAIHHGTPIYLAKLIQRYGSNRHLRSETEIKLCLAQRRTLVGRRSFSCAAPALWNSLPNDLRKVTNHRVFALKLYQHLLSAQIDDD
jgi:hypothetical protein